MTDYPRWDDLGPADRLRIAALEAELAGVNWAVVEAMCEAADLLERVHGRWCEHPAGRNGERPA